MHNLSRSHMQNKNLKPWKAWQSAFGYKQFISHLSCHGEGYYLLEQVAVLQKGHAGRGHLCRIEKSFGLSTI